MQDKLNISRGKPTSISAAASGQSLAEKMEALGQAALRQQEERKQAAIESGEVVSIKK